MFLKHNQCDKGSPPLWKQAPCKNADLPLGLGMALMQNTDAFLYFSALDKAEQARIIEQSKHVKSRSEMKSFVSGLSANG